MFISKHFVTLLVVGSLAGCSDQRTPSASHVDVTEIPQTAVKRQSINNCWAYAVAGWMESLHLAATGKSLDISESYFSYWASYDHLMKEHDATELGEGGSWSIARNIVIKYGYLLEGEFIPGEANKDMSAAQEAAVNAINKAMKPGGSLHGKESRTKQNVMKELDAAFGVNMTEQRKAAHSVDDLTVKTADGKTTTLGAVLSGDQKWTAVKNPQKYGVAEVPMNVQQKRKELLVRMMRALNDKQPLILSFKVGFGALDSKDGTFKVERAEANGLGQQAGHMVIIDDYVVDDVPEVGSIGEGEVSADLKEKALKGKIRYFKVKNSWGVNRSERGLSDGYSRINLDYLMTNMPWELDDGTEMPSSAFMEVVLPPEY